MSFIYKLHFINENHYTKQKHKDRFRVQLKIRGYNTLPGPPFTNLIPV